MRLLTLAGRQALAAPLIAIVCCAAAPDASAVVRCDPASATVQGTLTVEIPVSCTDSPPTPGSRMWIFVDPPSAGSARPLTDHSVSYTAPATPGAVTFTYGGQSVLPNPDGNSYLVLGTSERATITVTVTNPPPPPPPVPEEDQTTDTDGDGWGDFQDRCPAVRGGDPPGWQSNTSTILDGCPLHATPPFTHADALPALHAAQRAFLAAWKTSGTRAAALRSHRLDVVFRIPRRRDGQGRVRAGLSVFPWVLHGPARASIYGARWCMPGSRCVVHARVVPEGVRAYAGNAVRLHMDFNVGLPSIRSYARMWTGIDRRIRMRL